MPRLTDLPNELLLLIIRFVGGDERSLPDANLLDDYIFSSIGRFEALAIDRVTALPALSRLSRTSRRLYALAIPEIHRHICNFPHDRKLEPLFRRFFASPTSTSALASTQIISFFYYFKFDPTIRDKEEEEKNAYDVCRLLDLPNLRVLTTYAYSILDGFRPPLHNTPPSSNVTTIRLHDCSPEIGEEAFTNLFERLRALRHFSFKIEYNESNHHAWDPRILIRALHNQRTSLEALGLTLRFSNQHSPQLPPQAAHSAWHPNRSGTRSN